ncbi:MAG: colanic acid biosynthesis glycosyltransferase WcaL [Chloroflexi bacterium]|nr:MAG: colanic acid biosynthesis glycosyltransferase WcaL [Chloroflexota bacterium]
MGESSSNKQIGYLLRSYPRLSQTFILNEILALEKIGVSIQIFAMTDPHEKVVQMQVNQVQAPVQYIEAAIRSRPLRNMVTEHAQVARLHFMGYLRSLVYIVANGIIDKGYTASNRWDCFLQAVHLIYLLVLNERRTGTKIDHLHAHFAHDPTLIAYLVHCMTGIPFSFTAHARDLYQVPEKVLTDRIRRASAVVTCCGSNLEYLNRIAPSQQSKFSLIYHGVNLKNFQPTSNAGTSSFPEKPSILSVGRLVEKKGFQDLLQALLIVKERGKGFQCDIYGDGPLCDQLEKWIEEHGLAGEVSLKGDRTQQELISVYQNATLFILTPVQTEDGDRDGIPNVLVEAMAVGLPVITTAVSGIPELVENNLNGLLYQPHDVEGIASGIIELLRNGEKRRQFGGAASKKVREQFDITQAANRLKALFV